MHQSFGEGSPSAGEVTADQYKSSINAHHTGDASELMLAT